MDNGQCIKVPKQGALYIPVLLLWAPVAWKKFCPHLDKHFNEYDAGALSPSWRTSKGFFLSFSLLEPAGDCTRGTTLVRDG